MATATEAAWRATVPGATRTIESMVLHVAASKLVEHDFYHAGEINHLRSLLDTDDRWRWQQYEEPADGQTDGNPDP